MLSSFNHPCSHGYSIKLAHELATGYNTYLKNKSTKQKHKNWYTIQSNDNYFFVDFSVFKNDILR